MQKKYSLTIRGSQSSDLLRSSIDDLYSTLIQTIPSFSPQRFHVSLSVENGPSAPGPDRYKCTLIATFKRGPTLCMDEESGSLYDAAQSCFLSMRSALLERKRDKVDRRNDPARRVRLSQRGAA
jgi:hypothetical protein